MPRALPTRRVPRHHLMPHRPAQRRGQAGAPPLRTSDLVLALLGVALLGGLALAAALTLAAGATAP
ncbi:hypothetical protein [Methylobacterium oxalidis]|uniref:Uncharacterized protein n=1 Tax=Methylobacterium oxalidis TaxID=944322 RepID=A0A512J101_9HYPH|nr:hypothetical protein [Methylobacterium oxalidis]GEP03607.1 hypothetical protein MOX02_16450 [Methylobacterium oxalidis]GJE34312.1 hypothetical protein LDDCCGHA_4523 [Methylobacterium oxalidis]GLS64934.1 hypothetical protein GCM10007888_33150 [Methylobacterium oxalidis]